MKKFLVTQFNQTAPALTQAELKPPKRHNRKAHEHDLVLPEGFDRADAPVGTESPSASSDSIISIN